MAPKKRKNKNWESPHSATTDVKIAEEVETLFDKKFVLKTEEDTWELPPASSLFTEERPFVLEEMMVMKDKLNETKSLLNDLDIVEWHQHTRRVNKTGLIVKHLRQELQVELCTQAWAKFYEVVNTYALIAEEALEAGKFFSVHLCEGPGAFVTSLNHYLKTNHTKLQWDWVGCTLNPYYEGHDLKAMLDDDGFILETLGHWNFGLDSTGDLMNLYNLQALHKACQDRGAVHLVTADGSINCADQPAEQENLVAQLIYCETVAAMMLLSQGGHYVFKMFTAFEHQMICLLYLLSSVFKETHIIKPGTSKAGNSEVYLVCLQYIGRENLPEGYVEKLQKEYTPLSPKCSMFPHSGIPRNFLEKLKASEKHFTGLQMDAIDVHVQQFTCMNQWERRKLFKLRQHAILHFVERFHVTSIGKEDRVVPHICLDGTQLSYTRGVINNVPLCESFSGRHQTGTFNERQGKRAEGWLDSVQQDELFTFQESHETTLRGLCQAKNGTQLIPLTSTEVEWLHKPLEKLADKGIQQWTLQTGLRVEKLMNSRFCSPVYISKLMEARSGACVLRQENSARLREILEQISPSHLIHIEEGEVAVLDNLVQLADIKDSLVVGFNLGQRSKGFSDHFQKTGVKFKSVQCSVINKVMTGITNAENQKIGAIISRVQPRENCPLGDEELDSKHSILLASQMALQYLSRKGAFICCIYETLSRFTAGMLYILHHCFEEITIIKPITSPLQNPERYLVCKGFCGCEDHVRTFLRCIYNELATSDPCRDLLETVPMKHLYDETFYRFLKKKNEQLAHLQVQSIVRLEGSFQHPGVLAPGKQLIKLKAELNEYVLQGDTQL